MPNQQSYNNAKAQGFCVECFKNVPRVGRVRCEVCAERHRQWQNSSNAKRRSAGICVGCKSPIVTKGSRCDSCAERMDRSKISAHLKQLYGLTQADWDALYESQNGLCAVCQKPSRRKLCVDHNHTSGEVRGLLCHRCNILVGHLESDLAVNAYRYLVS